MHPMEVFLGCVWVRRGGGSSLFSIKKKICLDEVGRVCLVMGGRGLKLNKTVVVFLVFSLY